MEMRLKQIEKIPLERGGELRPGFSRRKLLHDIKILEKQIEELKLVEEKVSVQDEGLAAVKDAEENMIEKLTLVGKIKKKVADIMAVLIAFFEPTGKHIRTRKGKRVLKQFKELAALYAISVEMNPEETVAFDAAFGLAYYELLNIAKNIRAETGYEEAYVETMASFLNVLT
jgi:hypothetical protein